MIKGLIESLISAIHEPAMVISADGRVQVMNRQAHRLLQVEIRGSVPIDLHDISIENQTAVSGWLRICASCRDGIPGTLEIKNRTGIPSIFQVEGSLIQPAETLAETLILVTFFVSTEKYSRFIALNRKIEDLNSRLRETRKVQKKLRQRATLDSLTGLLNRQEFFEQATERLSRVRENEYYGALIMLDLDYFKRINDTFGHQCGDEVLQVTARRIQTNIRLSDIAGRYGGEEFIIYCSGHDPDDFLQTAERIRTTIADNPIKSKDHLIHITASLGVETFKLENTDPSHLSHMIGLADKSLYAAKREGRNRVCFSHGNESLTAGTVQYMDEGAS